MSYRLAHLMHDELPYIVDDGNEGRVIGRVARACSEADRDRLVAAADMQSALREIMELLEDGDADQAHTVAIRALTESGVDVNVSPARPHSDCAEK